MRKFTWKYVDPQTKDQRCSGCCVALTVQSLWFRNQYLAHSEKGLFFTLKKVKIEDSKKELKKV